MESLGIYLPSFPIETDLAGLDSLPLPFLFTSISAIFYFFFERQIFVLTSCILVTSKGSASRVYWAACAEYLRSAHAEMPNGILYYGVLYYGVLYYGMLYYGVLYYGVLYYGVLYYGVLYYGVLYYGILYYGVLYYGVLYYGVLYYV